MKRIFDAILLVFLMGLSISNVHADTTISESTRGNYDSTKELIETYRLKIKNQYASTGKQEKREQILEETRDYLFEMITNKILPAWYGTKWDYNGVSRKPGKGKIACGSFVVFTLQDAGFAIPSKMLQQPSEFIIKNLTNEKHIKRFTNHASMETVLKWVRGQGQGLFIVGLDNHVGYLMYKGDRVHFIHSNYYEDMVMDQIATEISPLTDSNYRVIGKILDNEMIEKWIQGDNHSMVYNYFRNNS